MAWAFLTGLTPPLLNADIKAMLANWKALPIEKKREEHAELRDSSHKRRLSMSENAQRSLPLGGLGTIVAVAALVLPTAKGGRLVVAIIGLVFMAIAVTLALWLNVPRHRLFRRRAEKKERRVPAAVAQLKLAVKRYNQEQAENNEYGWDDYLKSAQIREMRDICSAADRWALVAATTCFITGLWCMLAVLLIH